MPNLTRLTEAIENITGTDTETSQWLAARILGTLADMRRESGVTTDTGNSYPLEHGPWSVEPTALAAWETYRELKGE